MIIKGQNLMCFVGGKSIAFCTSSSIEVSGETVDVSTKDGGGEWATSEMGLLSWTASSENLVGDPRNGLCYDELFDIMIKKLPVELVFGYKTTLSANGEAYEVPEGGWTAKASDGYKGQAYITSLTVNAPNGENSTMSVSFTGTSALTKLNTTPSRAAIQTTQSSKA